MKLTEKVIVITGASRGFGEALARALAQEGATVVVNGRNASEIKRLANEIQGFPFVADVTDESQVENLATKTVEKFGRIDMWVNNAGIQHPAGPMEDVETKQATDIMQVNFFGTWYGSKVAVRQMKKQGYGTILNIISTSALKGYPGWSVYAASKHAADGLTKSMRLEVQPAGITVLSVYPGGMQTHLFGEAKPDEYSEYMNPSDVAKKVIANLKKEHPDEELILRRPAKQ